MRKLPREEEAMDDDDDLVEAERMRGNLYWYSVHSLEYLATRMIQNSRDSKNVALTS